MLVGLFIGFWCPYNINSGVINYLASTLAITSETVRLREVTFLSNYSQKPSWHGLTGSMEAWEFLRVR